MVMKDEQGRTLNKDGTLRKPRTVKPKGELKYFLVIPWLSYDDKVKPPKDLAALFEADYESNYVVAAETHQEALEKASKNSDIPEAWEEAKVITVVPLRDDATKRFKPVDIKVRFVPI